MLRYSADIGYGTVTTNSVLGTNNVVCVLGYSTITDRNLFTRDGTTTPGSGETYKYINIEVYDVICPFFVNSTDW